VASFLISISLYIAPINFVGTCKMYPCYFAGMRGNNDAFDMHQHASREDR
jgi:hypothetical protein